MNRGRRRKEDEGIIETVRACSCPVTLQSLAPKYRIEKTRREEYGSDNTLVRALKSAVPYHTTWIELSLHFSAVLLQN